MNKEKVLLKDFLEPYDIVIMNNEEAYVTIIQEANTHCQGKQQVMLFSMGRRGFMFPTEYDENFELYDKEDVSPSIRDMFSVNKIYKQKHIGNASLVEVYEPNLELKWRRRQKVRKYKDKIV